MIRACVGALEVGVCKHSAGDRAPICVGIETEVDDASWHWHHSCQHCLAMDVICATANRRVDGEMAANLLPS